ncbi:hypothetical protein BJ138DRAFT_154195 [Hygrophoropsis aurantiaca]|uniref:Uncharacterized protein n=1 Tax=Hygrophoropsis aurantiaca TaxID=72124 RepID=A0ACB7ZRT1_9AGAM|nr:hypothetical protein BJ138DRAFT_154195 [Hygrophoropsis aurantiaca]
MRPHHIPYVLEDRTGVMAMSDFDDIYDRLFLRVTPHPHLSNANNNVWAIYNMERRSSRHSDTRHLDRHPSVILEFGTGPGGGLGTVHFVRPPAASLSIPMARYLRKTALFGGSLYRKFTGSDGQEYRWLYKSIEGHEWTCLTDDNSLVAYYSLRLPSVPAYNVSGNTLTITEAFAHLSIDLIASLTIMRYIAEHNL